MWLCNENVNLRAGPTRQKIL